MHYRNPRISCDKYLVECLILLDKPITPADKEKIIANKVERKRLAKERKIQIEMIKNGGQSTIDLRKLNYCEKKKFSEEFDPNNKLDPWYMTIQPGVIFEFIDQYKYSLQKMLSPE